MTKIFHLRFKWADLVTEQNPLGYDCRGGVTVGMQEAENNTVIFAIAYCNMQDVYNRKRGRHIVTGRLVQGECYQAVVEPTDDFRDVLTGPVFSKIRQKFVSLYGDEATNYFEAIQ